MGSGTEICKVRYGATDLTYELLVTNRKTMEIAVHPNKEVTVKAPTGCSFEDVQSRVLKRIRWIKRQIRYFEQFDPRTPARQFVSGETHLYLGRRYRLKIELGFSDNVVLKNGFIIIYSQDISPINIQSLLSHWYQERSKLIFVSMFEQLWENREFRQYKKPNLIIRDLKTRWGSLSKAGHLTLNSNLVKAPKECIEYVLVHELCHLKHYNHSTAFYELLDNVMPDWIKRKHKLELSLV